ncbi:protein FAR1-RELATED SEQUENCE 6 [Spinacia oleracea]|uniref:Protein FAR1-RELATED SEQUENCE n=1 Tax=Spinacia oleracea TaxID=3562 RepID=A0A9R0JU91_SPIOL|nr:protein FAR1-RELATED SEQUENCE 6-like [Spinacia oleracea]
MQNHLFGYSNNGCSVWENPSMGIITDQCKAIGKAVQTAFPGVPHRLCVCHIMQNASRNLGKYSSWKEIDKYFQVVVHDTLTIEEFDDAWKSMVTKFGLQSDKWINETYRIRASWAPGYWRSSFWAGMSSSQRSEGMNRFFKTYVGLNTCLIQFMKQFEAALRGKVEEEKKLHLDSQNKPYTYNNTLIAEVVFCKAYTNTKFKEVRGEVMGLTHTNIVSTGRDGTKILYDAVEKIPIPVHKAKQKTFQVTIDKEMGEFTCSCMLFEFRGILCRHIIRAIHCEDVNSIPDKYILTRWRKNVVRDYESIKVEYYDPNDSTQVKNSREVAKRNNYISTLALHNSETLSIFMEATEKMRESLEDTIGIKRTDGDDFMDWWDPSSKRVFGRRRIRPKENNKQHLERSAVPVEGASKDPIDQRGKGRAQEKRKKHPAEKKTRKRRKNVVHDTDEDMDEENDEALPNGEQGHVDAGRSAGVTDSYYGGYQYYGGNFINPGYNPNFFALSSSNYRPNIYLNQQPLGRGYPNFSETEFKSPIYPLTFLSPLVRWSCEGGGGCVTPQFRSMRRVREGERLGMATGCGQGDDGDMELEARAMVGVNGERN